jgi:hypothetical protein
MLRGWDLPIQANISVSFNTKLILFNLVIAAVHRQSYSTDIFTDLRTRVSRPTCSFQSSAFARHCPPPYRPITADPQK